MNHSIAKALLCAILAGAGTTAIAQTETQIVIEPLFEYPVAPESAETLIDKSNYLLEHFWDKMNFKQKSVSQHALDDAFGVYATAMYFADRESTLNSIDALLKKLKKNPTLLIQFTKAAEDNLYGKRANIYSDEAYLPFLHAAVGNKKVPKLYKVRWEAQMRQLESSLIGGIIPQFAIEDRRGGKGHFEPRNKVTIIEFGDPGCDDCRFSRLTLDTNPTLCRLIDSEDAAVAFIVVSPETGWQAEVADYPPKWLVASAEGVDDILDIRTSPTFYVVDAKGKILAKNISPEQAANLAISTVEGINNPSSK